MPKILRFPDPPKPAMTWNYNKIIWFAIVILAGCSVWALLAVLLWS
jgi:hypothetical protein